MNASSASSPVLLPAYGETGSLSIDIAADLLLQGKLVAFPTETVYGLGAVVTNPEAVREIFKAKGRPATNPLIVHLADPADLSLWADAVPAAAQMLADMYWPGPLTLVLKRSSRIAPIVTAGLDWAGLRCPDHPVALALLRRVGVPLAAPSANRSEHISPTCAEHVVRSLGNNVAAVLDGGSCSAGLESTVIRLTDELIEILRPGPVTRQQLEVAGVEVVDHTPERQSAVSPGQAARHYAPDTPVVLTDDIVSYIQSASELHRVGIVLYSPSKEIQSLPHVIQMPADSEGYGRRLYEALHDLDSRGLERILIEVPPSKDGIWPAVHDRLRRCAG